LFAQYVCNGTGYKNPAMLAAGLMQHGDYDYEAASLEVEGASLQQYLAPALAEIPVSMQGG
jgi:hypothetical protein